MAGDHSIRGTNPDAPFELKVHRGDGMCLLAMNWRGGEPPNDFVGFGIEYMEPGGSRYFALKNRIAFPGVNGEVNPERLSTLQSPIQKFRWVHFPRNANLDGDFTYRVTPLFMNSKRELSAGPGHEIRIQLRRETYPGKLNVAFTRGFVSSQAFVDRYKTVSKLLPRSAKSGLTFVPTHPEAARALPWMGFEGAETVLNLLDDAVADATAQVQVVAYDLSLSHVVDRLKLLGSRLRIIVDDSKEHKPADAGESQAAAALLASGAQVKRQHLDSLQHNKMIVVDGQQKTVVFGSTNFSWRGFYVQNNNALVVHGERVLGIAKAAFEAYWAIPLADDVGDFPTQPAADWADLQLDGIDAKVTFSPHGGPNQQLQKVADDILTARSSVLYSLAFLAQTDGPVRKAVETVTDSPVFVYGIADKEFGIEVQNPDGNVQPVSPVELAKNLPVPFSKEPTAGNVGTRMHHKFVVIDFDTPDARVYAGSYNFSDPADRKNGENLVLIRDARVATSYMVEALRIFDHYSFRVKQKTSGRRKLQLRLPPAAGEDPWWKRDYAEPRRMKDRVMFCPLPHA